MSVTNGWNAAIATNQNLLGPLRRYLVNRGLLPDKIDYQDAETSSEVKLRVETRAASLSIDTATDNTLDITLPFAGVVVAGGQAPTTTNVEGTAEISVDLSSIGLNAVWWPDYLSVDGSLDSNVSAGDLSETFSSSACTLETWVRIDESKTWQLLFGIIGENLYQPGFFLAPDNKLWIAWEGTVNYLSSDTTPVINGNWHHLAAVMDQGTLTFYKDGQAKDSLSMDDYTSGTATFIGALYPQSGTEMVLNGSMTQTRIWSVARTAEEIQQSMNADIEASSSGLLGYWTFSDGGMTNEVTGTVGSLSGGAVVVNDGSSTASYTNYVNFYGNNVFSAPIITLGEGADDAGTAVQDAFSDFFTTEASQAYLLRQANNVTYQLPTQTSFLSYGNDSEPSAGQLFSLSMTQNVAPPSSAGDFSAAMPEGSCTLVALEDVSFFNLLLGIFGSLGWIDPSQFTVDSSSEPATVMLEDSIVLYEGSGPLTEFEITSLSCQFTDDSLTAEAGFSVGYSSSVIGDGTFDTTVSTTLTASLDDSGKGISLQVVGDWAFMEVQASATAVAGWDIDKGKLKYGFQDISVSVDLQSAYIDDLNSLWKDTLDSLPLSGEVMEELGYPIEVAVKAGLEDLFGAIASALEGTLDNVLKTIGDDIDWADYAWTSSISLDDGILISFTTAAEGEASTDQ